MKGGQLVTPEGVQAMTRLVDKTNRLESVEPLPLRPVEDDFRALSPRPDLTDRAAPARKVVKNVPALNARKQQPQATAKDAPKKPAKKG
uniref:Uncharacterized protein n=1 Tax=Fundidesulfovibrio putealis TaxID=270496 RepID=A0A7C4AI16_9BACT